MHYLAAVVGPQKLGPANSFFQRGHDTEPRASLWIPLQVLTSLSSRKEDVKRRCRTVLQSKAEALLRNQNPRPESQHPTNAHPTLALV